MASGNLAAALLNRAPPAPPSATVAALGAAGVANAWARLTGGTPPAPRGRARAGARAASSEEASADVIAVSRLRQLDELSHVLRTTVGTDDNQVDAMWSAVATLRSQDPSGFERLVRSALPVAADAADPGLWLRRFTVLGTELPRLPDAAGGTAILAAVPRRAAELQRSEPASPLPAFALAALGRLAVDAGDAAPGAGPTALQASAMVALRHLALDCRLADGEPVDIDLKPGWAARLGHLAGTPAHEAARGLLAALRGTRYAGWQPSLGQALIGLARRVGAAPGEIETDVSLLLHASDRREPADRRRWMVPGGSMFIGAPTLASQGLRQDPDARVVLCRLATLVGEKESLRRHLSAVHDDIAGALADTGPQAFARQAAAAQRGQAFLRATRQSSDARAGLHALWRREESGFIAPGDHPHPAAAIPVSTFQDERPASTPRVYRDATEFVHDTELQRTLLAGPGPVAVLELETALGRLAEAMARTANASAPDQVPEERTSLTPEDRRRQLQGRRDAASLDALREAYARLEDAVFSTPQLQTRIAALWAEVFNR